VTATELISLGAMIFWSTVGGCIGASIYYLLSCVAQKVRGLMKNENRSVNQK